jgi:hypothetical protein
MPPVGRATKTAVSVADALSPISTGAESMRRKLGNVPVLHLPAALSLRAPRPVLSSRQEIENEPGKSDAIAKRD